MIKADALLEITLDNIPKEVNKEIENIEKKLIQCAKEGKRGCSYSINGSLYNHKITIVKILSNANYNVTYAISGTQLEIRW